MSVHHENRLACFLLLVTAEVTTMQITKHNEKQSGRVLVPAIMYFMGVPFGIVLLLWFFFFRG